MFIYYSNIVLQLFFAAWTVSEQFPKFSWPDLYQFLKNERVTSILPAIARIATLREIRHQNCPKFADNGERSSIYVDDRQAPKCTRPKTTVCEQSAIIEPRMFIN